MNRLLVVENDVPFSKVVNSFLMTRGFAVDSVNSCIEAAKGIAKKYDSLSVVIFDELSIDSLDLNLIDLIKKYFPCAGIIIMSSNKSFSFRLKLLTNWCDEFLTKPFSLLELEFRIRRLIQYKTSIIMSDSGSRYNTNENKKTKYYIDGPWLYKSETRQKLLQLSKTQSELFKVILQHDGKLVNSETLKSKLRNYSTNALSVALHRLNQLFGKSNINMKIKALYGFGYVLEESTE